MKRVVITGIGLVTPLGTGREKAWKNLLAGECGIDKITQFDSSNHPVHIAAEVKDFEAEKFIEKKEMKKIARFSQFAIAASKEALEDAKLEITEENADRIGTIIGSGIGGLDVIEQEVEKLVTRGPKRVSPFYIPAAIANMASGNTSIYTGAKGPNKTVVTACASGTNSIGDAFQTILLGKADAMIAGGTEATVTPSGIAGFANLKALSTNPDPKTASRPFTADRDGFVLGEGAGVLILEELEHAKEEGINFMFLTNPIEIIPDENGWVKAMKCIKMELGEPDASGRRRPVPIEGSEFDLEVETVIMSIGTSPNPLISQTTSGLELNKWKCIVANEETGQTTRDRVFAGGDAVTGAATVILAMGAGKKAAKAIDEMIKSRN